MSRIAQRFKDLRKRRKKAMIPFITAGDPERDATVPLWLALVANGADLLELGIPFSDPAADGPVIRQAAERALARGTKLSDVLGMVRTFRRHDRRTPVILMGYLHSVSGMGYDRFLRQAQSCGADGVLLADLSVEQAQKLCPPTTEPTPERIFLITPGTAEERIARICHHASGFVYCVATSQAITGTGRADTQLVEKTIKQIKRHTRLPVAAGFGIRDADSAAAVARFSDAVVIGSALVETIHHAVARRRDLGAEIKAFLSPVRAALDQPAVRP